jgi:hypothetical protein
MAVYLEMTTKDVTLYSMYYITDYQYHLRLIFNCADQRSLSEQFHLM